MKLIRFCTTVLCRKMHQRSVKKDSIILLENIIVQKPKHASYSRVRALYVLMIDRMFGGRNVFLQDFSQFKFVVYLNWKLGIRLLSS